MLFAANGAAAQDLQLISLEELNATPSSEIGSKPQGIVMLNDTSFILSVHHHDTKSTIYKINKVNQEIENQFDMPIDATHTGGLTIMDSLLIAVDYNANKIYLIDYEKSFKNNKAEVVKSISTGLKGTSAITSFQWNSNSYIAVSDFLNSRTTYLLDFNRLKATNNFSDSQVAQYKNGWFSQGLAFHDGHIYESRNGAFGKSYIEVRKIDDILNGNQVRVSKARISLKGIEDIDFDGKYWWTSDERSFRIYKIELQYD